MPERPTTGDSGSAAAKTLERERQRLGITQGELAARCGLHQSEIDRISSGKGIIKQVAGQGEIAGTIRFVHKNTSEHTISVDAQGLASAKRLQAKGSAISESFLRVTLAHASRKAGLAASISPGELRHSFITWCREAGREVRPKLGGASLEAIAGVVGHHGTRTTRNVYLGAHVPLMIVVPIELTHPDDPKLLTLRAV